MFTLPNTHSLTKNKQHLPAAATAAIASVTVPDDEYAVIDWVWYSYSAAPTGGNLKIDLGGTVLVDVDITAAGPGFVSFGNQPLTDATKGSDITVTLASGGGAIVGSLQIGYR